MIKVDDNLIQEMTDAIVRGVNPAQVILFGSRARGIARADSDVDFLVVVDQTFGPGQSRRAEMMRIRKLLSAYRVPKDILVYGSDEVARWRNSQNHIVSHCLREGKLLYDRS